MTPGEKNLMRIAEYRASARNEMTKHFALAAVVDLLNFSSSIGVNPS
jgi:hypothetical protein